MAFVAAGRVPASSIAAQPDGEVPAPADRVIRPAPARTPGKRGAEFDRHTLVDDRRVEGILCRHYCTTAVGADAASSADISHLRNDRFVALLELVSAVIEEMAPEDCGFSRMSQQVGVARKDLVCGECLVVLSDRFRIMVLDERNGHVGPKAHEPGRLVVRCSQSCKIIMVQRLAQLRPQREIERRTLPAAAVGAAVRQIEPPVGLADPIRQLSGVFAPDFTYRHARLAEEGVVGADAIFACLGPALEIFSRYSRVEKASGESAELREYLEHVWAAVSTEALSMIFQDADAAGLEPDARLTAMWLWTLGGGNGKSNGNGADDEDAPPIKSIGYVLEFDTARKIAQGLGIHLEKNDSIVEVKGDKARLLPVSERTAHLFGKGTDAVPSGRRKNKVVQRTLFDELDEVEAAEAGWSELKGPPPGSTVLDRLHQAMILFAAGRGELLKRFLTDEGVGHDGRFWKLARSLSALYPRGSEENRWVDGVLGRKKGLGL